MPVLNIALSSTVVFLRFDFTKRFTKLKRLVKSNCRKTTVELRAMFNSESKSISTRTMQRELKGLGLNSCVALRKPLISEANRKKRLQFASEHKDWTLEQWKKVM